MAAGVNVDKEYVEGEILNLENLVVTNKRVIPLSPNQLQWDPGWTRLIQT